MVGVVERPVSGPVPRVAERVTILRPDAAVAPGHQVSHLRTLTLLSATLVLAFLVLAAVPPPAHAGLLEQRKGELARTQDRLKAMQADMDRATQQYAQTVAEIARTENNLARAQSEEREARVELAEKKARLAQRLVDTYKQNHASFPVLIQVIMGEQDLTRLLELLPHLARVAEEDKELVDEVRGLMQGLQAAQKEIDRERALLLRQQRQLQATRGELARVMKQADAERRRLAKEVSVLTAADNLVQQADRARSRWRGRTSASVWRLARGFAFPVDGPHSFIHDWGFPRSDDRTHKGTDIMAPAGTPVVAVQDGVITRIEHGAASGRHHHLAAGRQRCELLLRSSAAHPAGHQGRTAGGGGVPAGDGGRDRERRRGLSAPALPGASGWRGTRRPVPRASHLRLTGRPSSR